MTGTVASKATLLSRLAASAARGGAGAPSTSATAALTTATTTATRDDRAGRATTIAGDGTAPDRRRPPIDARPRSSSTRDAATSVVHPRACECASCAPSRGPLLRGGESAASRGVAPTSTSGSLRPWTIARLRGDHPADPRGVAGSSFAARGLRTGARLDKDAATGDDDANAGEHPESIDVDATESSDDTDSRRDDPLPENLAKPSWLRKRLNRSQKGSYEGMLTEIDSYPDFDPPEGNLYNVADFGQRTIETDPSFLAEWRADYMKHQKELWAASTGNDVSAMSDEEFIAMYDAEFAVDAEEESRRILTWEVVNVLEAAGDGKHPLNRKVVLRVRLDALQGETGLSDEALEYIAEICGSRFDAKRREIRITCSRSGNREHNRQWCLKVLYDLIMEGNREYPSESYRFTPEGPVEPGTVGKQ